MPTTYNAASAALADVTTELAKCVSGDTVVVPAGAATWGTAFNIPAGVTLEGQGLTTEITCTVANSQGTVRLDSGSTLKNFRMIGATSSPCMGVLTGAQGWRISGITYTSTAANSYFLLFSSLSGGTTYGLIDNCDITGPGSTSELIYTRGPSDAWDNVATYGTDQAVYIEDCIFRGAGYVSDFNANAKGVVRNCTVLGQMKVDLHGVASNSPARSGRHMEVYRNTWSASGVYAAIEHRGGGLLAFLNTHNVSGTSGSLRLHDYAFNASFWTNFDTMQTPANYPIRDQIGRGRYLTPGDWTSAESEPCYLWGNRRVGAKWNISFNTSSTAANGTRSTTGLTYPVGTTQIHLTGTGKFGTGTSFLITGDSTRYVVTVGRASGSSAPITISPPLAQEIVGVATLTFGSQQNYKYQTANEAASFTPQEVILADRDYFDEATSFNGSSGVGIGTRAQMDAILPTKPGVGFWVTDEGSWDTTLPANTSGRLYRWTGSAWELYYTPYTYPHPLRGALAAPAFIAHPASRTVEEGQATTLTATASGNPAVTYQWRKGGVNVSGANSSSLVFASVTLADAGSYDCVATNSQGSATSTAATLTVDAVTPGTAPTITTQPQSVTVCEGDDAVFSLHAEGDPLPTYQWRKGGVNLSGKTTASLLISPASEADEGSYDCVVTNAAGTATSNAATLTVDPAPASTPSPLGNRGTRAFLAGVF